MPGRIRSVRHGYKVTWGGKTVAKHTSQTNARRQLKLLRAIEHGWKVPKKRR
jgi:hypothetical protein